MAKRGSDVDGADVGRIMGVRVPPDLLTWLDAQATLHGLVRSELIRRILLHHKRHSKHRHDLHGVLFGK